MITSRGTVPPGLDLDTIVLSSSQLLSIST